MVNVKPLRLFFALWPDDRVRDALAAVSARLQRSTSARWVSPDKLHMTLAFLGQVQADLVGTLTEAAASGLTVAPFQLQLDRLEWWRKPGIVCLGSSSPPAALNALAGGLAANLGSAGFELEKRPFRAHLTLARKAKSLPPELERVDPVLWSVSSFTLMESQLDRKGSSYVLLQSWPLAGAPCTMPGSVSMG